jgi:hypothetical protein
MEIASVNQPVTDLLRQGPLARLLAGADYSLADWYATPLSPSAAGVWLTAAHRAVQDRLRSGASCFALQVLLRICRFWKEGRPAADAVLRAGPLHTAHEAALLELVHGQLLASCKLQPAYTHLARGFRQAAPWLETADYFRLLREHELLACLPLSDTPSAAQDLPALLNEAAVIRRLQRGERRRPAWPHLDTLG